MWKYLKCKIANNPKVKSMSPSQRKSIGGKIIICSTVLLLIPLIGMFMSYNNAVVHIVFQLIWGISMIIGGVIAFESEPETSTGAK
uniref:Uncharacterized protein n=1 Tax=Pectobacterium carotovorum TaxID=554 RepID=A0A0N9NLT6_PECCA|nr:hypothetical protein [Pectobacterium carotovorum]ALG88562.1 Hypothetical protein [Pectobacterium carotovorum]